MEKAQQKKLVKIWVAEMLGGRWEKTKRQKMKKCKKTTGQRQIGGGGGVANLVLWWPTHEKPKLGHYFYLLHRILKSIGVLGGGGRGEGGHGLPTGTQNSTPCNAYL